MNQRVQNELLTPETAVMLLDQAPDGVLLLDLGGVVRHINQTGVVWHGLGSASEAVGSAFSDLWQASDAGRMAAAVSECAGGGSRHVQAHAIPAGSATLRLDCTFTRLAASDGAQPLIVVRTRESPDAPATPATEESVVWQVSPDLMGVLGADGIFERSNPAWQTLLGWSPAEVATTPFFDFLHPDDLQRNREALAEALEHGVRALRFENRYRCKSGGWCWLSWVAIPDPDGGKIHCVARDISAEKQREQMLAERNRERDTAWSRSLDLLVVATPGEGHITAVNPAWTRLLGWSEAELIGHGVAAFTHPDDLQSTLAAFAGIATAPLLVPHENRLRDKDGGWHWFAWTAALESGAVYGVGRETTADHDRIEALLQAEASLRQAQKMEAVGQLTGGIAHDFNNLLAAISGSLERLRKRIGEGRLDEVERYLTMAQGASKRAAALTHRLLAFSRQQVLDPQTVDLNRLVAEMEELLRRSIGPSIELAVTSEPGLWPVLADPSQVENALLNLCINARDAMPEGGALTISTRNEQIDAAMARGKGIEPGPFVSLCVSDTGIGMPAALLEKVFDPFFTTKPVGMGTGLGLSMVYGFARQSHGMARIESEPGRGTRVWVTLPRSEAVPGATGEAVASASGPIRSIVLSRSKRLLVVDDEPAISSLLVEILQEEGYEVAQATDADEALALIALPGELDLLISDIGLPGRLNGRQLADAARLLRPSLTVLFITGYGDQSAVREHGPLNPGIHLITKPFEMAGLLRRVQELVIASEPQSST